ncbi:hypothetical protein ABZX51_003768 [Aspergillus tubingensis]
MKLVRNADEFETKMQSRGVLASNSPIMSILSGRCSVREVLGYVVLGGVQGSLAWVVEVHGVARCGEDAGDAAAQVASAEDS